MSRNDRATKARADSAHGRNGRSVASLVAVALRLDNGYTAALAKSSTILNSATPTRVPTMAPGLTGALAQHRAASEQ